MPHGPLLDEPLRVWHGGMGDHPEGARAGVPVCVVPFGRDQLEVARHVKAAGVGTVVQPFLLKPRSLRRAVRAAIGCRDAAERMAAAFARAGGASAAAGALERLVPAPSEPEAVTAGGPDSGDGHRPSR